MALQAIGQGFEPLQLQPVPEPWSKRSEEKPCESQGVKGGLISHFNQEM